METYQQVANTVSTRDRVRTANFKKLLKGGQSENMQQMVFEQLMNDWGGSILTIRNRWDVFFGIPLSDAIKAARKEMPSLRKFHCIFCRCTMLPKSVATKLGQTQKESVDVRYRQ